MLKMGAAGNLQVLSETRPSANEIPEVDGGNAGEERERENEQSRKEEAAKNFHPDR